ncbi:MAG: porin family protein [Ferruginibacter sp.]
MKKLFFITALALSSLFLKAQHVELGLKGGLNVATVHYPNSSSNYDPRVSLHVGGLAHIHLTKEFAIQPEIVFSGQGYKTGNDIYKFNYLNVPVLVQYMFKSGFRLETGPQVGFLLSAKKRTNNVETDIKNNLKNVDLAWAFGAGYILPSGFGFDARLNLGIAKVNNDPGGIKTTNGVFQFGVFYQFKALKH